MAITGSSVGGFVSALLVNWSVAGKSWSDSFAAIRLTSIGIGVLTIAWLRSGGTGVIIHLPLNLLSPVALVHRAGVIKHQHLH